MGDKQPQISSSWIKTAYVRDWAFADRQLSGVRYASRECRIVVGSGRYQSYRSAMSVSLLNVGDHFSLEFDTSDLDAVRSYIRERYGKVSSKAAGIATVVTFGGEDFTFQNEWDDPCVISHSVKGDDLLRAIHAHFHAR